MNKPEVSIILVSYNTKEHTLKAIASVYEQAKDVSFEIVMVDNDSEDGSLEAVQERFPDVKSYASGENLGFAGGVHYGVDRSSSDLILLLNPDTIVLDGAVDTLVKFSREKSAAGIWGGITLNNDLSLNTQHAWARHNFFTLLFSALGLSKIFPKSCFFNNANYGCWERDTVKEVDILSGCFFLTTRSLWEKLGGLDVSFFMYAEEADYCLRAKKLGYQPTVTPDARIIHHGGISHANLAAKEVKLLRGKVELIKRHDKGLFRSVYISLIWLYSLNKMIESAVLKRGSVEATQWRKVFDERSVWIKGY